jgi:citrate lyase beta subunit
VGEPAKRLRRAVVVVPVISRAALAHASEIDADEVVLDLEAIPAHEKTDFLRVAVADAINATRWRAPTIAVQVNLQGTRWFDEDLIQLVMLVGSGIDCMVVPNVTSVENVRAASELLDEIEFEFPVENRIGLEVRIGSSQGLMLIEQIVAASERLEAVVFDADLYAESLDLAVLDADGSYPLDRWQYARRRTAAVARSRGIVAIYGLTDTRYTGAMDQLVQLPTYFGYSGKWTQSALDVDELRRIFAGPVE